MASLWDDLRRPLRELIEQPPRPKDTITLETATWHRSAVPGAPAPSGEALFSGDAVVTGTVEDFVPTPEIRTFVAEVFNKVLSGEGQGWWLQAEYGSGKSHLLAFLTIMCCTIDNEPWDVLARTEKEREGKGKRESLANDGFRGLKDKLVFPIAISLAGAGGSVVGSDRAGNPLIDYILNSARSTYEDFTGKPLRAFPDEILADHFMQNHTRGQEADLGDWLREQAAQGSTSADSYDAFRELYEASPHDAGKLLWRFAEETRALATDQIPTDPRAVLTHLVDSILAEGFEGVLVVLDEVSEFLNRSSDLSRDEDVLICLSELLPRASKKPVWTICAAQQKIEEKAGMKRIIAENRLKEQNLLTDPLSFHDIVLKRTRRVTSQDGAVDHFRYYQGRFGWVDGLAQTLLARVFQTRYQDGANLDDAALAREFYLYLFPLHPDVLNQTKAVAFKLTTTRAGIVVVYDAIRQQLEAQAPGDKEMVTPDRLFDQFESLTDGDNTFKSKFPGEYEAFGKARDALARTDSVKRNGDAALRALKTLFMAYLEDTGNPRRLTPAQVCDSIMMTRKPNTGTDENTDAVRLMLGRMKRPAIPQVCGTGDDSEFWFDASVGIIEPSEVFQQAVEDLNHQRQQHGGEVFKVDELARAWDRWMLFGAAQTQTTGSQQGAQYDDTVAWMQRGAAHVRTDFGSIIASRHSVKRSVLWHGREIQGRVELVDLSTPSTPQAIRTGDSKGDDQDIDFVVRIGRKPDGEGVRRLVRGGGVDPRYLFWVPASLDTAQQDVLIHWAAYVRLVDRYLSKQGEEAELVRNWVSQRIAEHAPKIMGVLVGAYAAGVVTSSTVDSHQITYQAAGQLDAAIENAVTEVLDNVYTSADLTFDVREMGGKRSGFRNEDAVHVINGLVRLGKIGGGREVSSAERSAAERHATGLQLTAQAAPGTMDLSACRPAQEIRDFILDKTTDAATIELSTLYLNFMGIDPQSGKGQGLTRRMVQLYVLAWAQQGELRLTLRTGAGGLLNDVTEIDHSNIASVTFNHKVLDDLKSVARVEVPAEWECVRGFTGTVLGRDLAGLNDEKQIREYWDEFTARFESQHAAADRIEAEFSAFLRQLGHKSPSLAAVQSVVKVLGAELTGTQEQQMRAFAWALQDACGYKLTDGGKWRTPKKGDQGDFESRWTTYQTVCSFVEDTKDRVLVASRYVAAVLPEDAGAAPVREQLAVLGACLQRLEDLILKPALVQGEFEPAFRKATDAYFDLYQARHNAVLRASEQAAERVGALRADSRAVALAALDAVPSLGSSGANSFRQAADAIERALHTCDVSTETDLRALLAREMTCKCLLTLCDAEARLQESEAAGSQVEAALGAALGAKAAVLCSEAIRARLQEAHRAQPDERLARILEAGTPEAVAECLVDLLGQEAPTTQPSPRGKRSKETQEALGLVELLKRALGDIVTVEVDWQALRPALAAVERGQIDQVLAEVRAALERSFDQAGSGQAQVIVQWK